MLKQQQQQRQRRIGHYDNIIKNIIYFYDYSFVYLYNFFFFFFEENYYLCMSKHVSVYLDVSYHLLRTKMHNSLNSLIHTFFNMLYQVHSSNRPSVRLKFDG